MKKLWLILTLAATVLLAACSQQNTDKVQYERYGETYIITSQTITHGADVYHYEDDGSTFSVTYPNGATYYCNYSGTLQTSGWSNDYDPVRYIPGDELMEITETGSPQKSVKPVSFVGIVLSVVICGYGIWCVADPNAAWFLHRGWMFRNAEPSDWGLMSAKVGGVISILVSVLLFILALSGKLS